MTETSPHALDINYLVYKVGTSDAYKQARNDPELRELNERDQRRTAIRMAAVALSGERESGYLTTEGHALNITAELTTFSDSVFELDELKAHGASYEETLPLRLKMVEFNHAIKDMIDSNPSLQYDQMLTFIRSMNQTVNGREGAQQFEVHVRRVLNGMRHEIAVEQMLGYMPDVEYREATVTEDLNGADLFISINNSPMTGIDIKSSNKRAHSKRESAANLGFNPNGIIWSRVTAADFDGGFRISNETAAEKAPLLHESFERAIQAEHGSEFAQAV